MQVDGAPVIRTKPCNLISSGISLGYIDSMEFSHEIMNHMRFWETSLISTCDILLPFNFNSDLCSNFVPFLYFHFRDGQMTPKT